MQSRFSRSIDEIEKIVSFTEKVFDQHKIDQSLRNRVDLCIEELFVNMVKYNRETDADILIEMSPHEQGVKVSLTDYGVERFDPRSSGPVNIDASLDKRIPGGLGLYLVLKMVDSINYEYRDRTSKITFVVGQQ